MASPPSYEESAVLYQQEPGDSKGSPQTESKGWLRLSLRQEVSSSRLQHVAALVSKLLPHVRDRAKEGFSRSTLLLVPSDQGKSILAGEFAKTDEYAPDAQMRGQLVEISEDERPILIRLDGPQDRLEFWMQQEALDMLRNQLTMAISDDVPAATQSRAPAKIPDLPPATKTSIFGRKKSGPPQATSSTTPEELPSASAQVQLDEVHFRSETEFGLLQTTTVRCVMVALHVR